MSLTNENYFSIENNMKYMGTTQFKTFMDCQARGLAEVKGEYVREKTSALLVGSYVDAHFEKSLDLFKAQNPEIFTQKGTLKAEYKNAEDIIARLEKDKLFMQYMSGEKQIIQTGEIGVIPFKIKIDSFIPNRYIVDLKVMKDFKNIWKDGLKISFVEAWGYDFQAAIYQAVNAEATGTILPFIIAGATKEKEPDLELFFVPQQRIDYCFEVVQENAPIFANIKLGLIEPTRCGKCDYCKSTKVLTEVVDYNLYDND
jgi:hypothetical protein